MSGPPAQAKAQAQEAGIEAGMDVDAAAGYPVPEEEPLENEDLWGDDWETADPDL